MPSFLPCSVWPLPSAPWHEEHLAFHTFSIFLSTSARAEVDKKIEKVWKAKCSSCHGADGKGQTEQGKKLGIKDYTAPEWQKSKTDDELKKAIADGVKGMDGYKDK